MLIRLRSGIVFNPFPTPLIAALVKNARFSPSGITFRRSTIFLDPESKIFFELGIKIDIAIEISMNLEAELKLSLTPFCNCAAFSSGMPKE